MINEQGAEPGSERGVPPRMNEPVASETDGFFEDVMGVAPAVFLRDVFERRHHGPHRTAARLRTTELVTMADIDHLLNDATLSPEDVHIIQDGAATHHQRAFDRKARLDFEYVYQLFDQGASFRIHDVHRHLPPVAGFARKLAATLAAEVTANVYISPAGGDVLGVHYDGLCVFVLQCLGTKRWRLFAPRDDVPQLPRRLAQRFDPARHQPGDVIAQASLAPGDVLYMPRGTMHEATAEDDVSLHLTFGIQTPTWGELALCALQSAVGDDDALRTAVPHAMRLNPAAAADAAAPAIVRALMGEKRLARSLAEYRHECRSAKTIPAQHWFSDRNGLGAERARL